MKTLEELKQMKIWMLWRRKVSGSRVAKVPCSATGKLCGVSDNFEKDWVTWEAAQQALKTVKADGVGFRIPNGMFFLDIDHRDLEDPWVKALLDLYDSYTEYSVSGEGIHIYGLCDVGELPTYIDTKDGKLKLSKDYYTHHPDNGLELYMGQLTNRFAAFTGNVILDRPLQDCTDSVLYTLDCCMKKSKKTTNKESKADKIITALRNQKNGAKFSELFDHGLIEGKSHSEADAILCALIAFRAGDNPALIDEVFRKSALYREKWERTDYREATIANGIALCNKRQSRKKETPPFIKIDDKQRRSVSAPLLARFVREHLDYLLVRDNGNQAILIYVYKNGVYQQHDLNMLYGEVKQFIASYDEELVKMSVVKEAVQLILSDLDYTSQDVLNSNEGIINFQNGLLQVSGDEVKLIPHTPKELTTIQIPCSWAKKEVPTPVFDKYMDTLTNGNAAIKQLLLEFMGVAISNVKGWRMKKALFLVGDGNTGKSQLKSLTEKLLGKGNYIGIDLAEIEARFGTGAIYGTRLAGSSDMSFLSVDQLKTFKKISGGDSLFMEFKGQQPFEATYNGILWFCTNRLPKFSGDKGDWVYSRMIVINCPNVIPPDQQDKQLLDKMYAEREGIVQKCVRALQTVIANGYRFSEPESVFLAREQYKAANSTVVTFFEECMCPWPDGKIGGSSITTGTIHKVYLQWCKGNNNGYSSSAKEFREELAAHLNTSFAEMTTRIHGNTFYKEWTLTTDAQNDFGYVL